MATPSRPTADRNPSDVGVRNLPLHLSQTQTEPLPPFPTNQVHTQSILNSTTDPSTGELTAVVDDLLNQLNSKFSSVSTELLAKSKYSLGVIACAM
jgi:hypothetical protein